MPNKKDRINPLDVAMRQVDIAAERLELDPGLREKIKQAKRELIVHFKVLRRCSPSPRERKWI